MTVPRHHLDLVLLSGLYAVCRLPAEADSPVWAAGEFVSITRTAEELSVVCHEDAVAAGVRCERGWRCLRVAGTSAEVLDRPGRLDLCRLPTTEPLMRIGLDLDGLLDERPDFFAFLTAALRAGGHFVAVLTYRDPDSRARTEEQLAGWGISFDELHFARSLADKGRLCRELDIDIYFDDQDECLQDVPEGTTVFKVRNGGNFDFEQRKWLSTARLTRLL